MTTTPAVRTIATAPDGIALAESDGMLYLLTACCGASATGTEHGVACRGCYQPIDDFMGDAAMVSDATGVRRMAAYVAVPRLVGQVVSAALS